MVTCNTKKDHVKHPHNECNEASEAGEQTHEYCAHTVVRGSAQPKEECQPWETCGYGMENERHWQVVYNGGVQIQMSGTM